MKAWLRSRDSTHAKASPTQRLIGLLCTTATRLKAYSPSSAAFHLDDLSTRPPTQAHTRSVCSLASSPAASPISRRSSQLFTQSPSLFRSRAVQLFSPFSTLKFNLRPRGTRHDPRPFPTSSSSYPVVSKTSPNPPTLSTCNPLFVPYSSAEGFLDHTIQSPSQAPNCHQIPT